MTEMKKVNWKVPFLLALSLFVLGSFAYWMEFQQKPKREEKEEQAKKLFLLKDTQVQSVNIVTGKKAYLLKCLDLEAKLCKPGDNSKWEVAEPVKLRADDSNVNSLLSTLNNINASDTIGLKEESPEKRAALLKDYGLDPLARADGRRIEVTTGAGTALLYLGQTHPIGEAIFALRGDPAQVDENSVYLIPNYFRTNFEKDLTHWRDKKLVNFAAQDVINFKLDGGKAKSISGAKSDGKWSLNFKKESYPGDTENIEALLNSLSFLAAKDFVAESKDDKTAKAALRGAKVDLKISVEKGEQAKPGETVVLTLYRKSGKTADRLFATVSNKDQLFELEINSKNRLDKDLKDLRLTKLITSMERFTAKRLEFSGTPIGSPPLVAVNTEGKWVSMPEKVELDSEKLQKMLDKLSGNRIKEFLTGRQIPAGEKDGLRVLIGDAMVEKKQQFVFWKNSGKLYARDHGSQRPEAFLIDFAVQDDLPWNRDFFKPTPKPSPTPPAEQRK